MCKKMSYIPCRCALPHLSNDTYASQGPWHDDLVNASIPWDDKEEMYKQCDTYRGHSGLENDTGSCSEWVYSKDPFENTFVTDVRFSYHFSFHFCVIDFGPFSKIMVNSIE